MYVLHLHPQGITKAAGSVDESLTMVRLWTHEVLRVFYDRCGVLIGVDASGPLSVICVMISVNKHFASNFVSFKGVRSIIALPMSRMSVLNVHDACPQGISPCPLGS